MVDSWFGSSFAPSVNTSSFRLGTGHRLRPVSALLTPVGSPLYASSSSPAPSLSPLIHDVYTSLSLIDVEKLPRAKTSHDERHLSTCTMSPQDNTPFDALALMRGLQPRYLRRLEKKASKLGMQGGAQDKSKFAPLDLLPANDSSSRYSSATLPPVYDPFRHDHKVHPHSPSKSNKSKRHSVHEMLQVARECSGRDPADLQLSFGEFCLFSRELKSSCYQNQTPCQGLIFHQKERSNLVLRSPRSPCGQADGFQAYTVFDPRNPKSSPLPVSKMCSESPSPTRSRRSDRTMSKSPSQYQVFLGGSCNPTTWRQDVAIPMLSRHGITYYNPQVSHWKEELVEKEFQAKRNASVLLFVFDSLTRNVASMIEAGYMAGCRRKLVLVIEHYSGPGHFINGEAISEAEYEELNGGLLMIQSVGERQGIPVFSKVAHALTCTAKILREDMWPQDLNSPDKVQPVKHSNVPLGDKLLKLRDAFVNMNSNRISLADANVVFKVVTNRALTKDELATIVASKKGTSAQEITSPDSLQDFHLTFQEFCCIVAEFDNQTMESRSLWDFLTQSIMSPIQKIFDLAIPRPFRMTNGQETKDVYLGGSQGPRISWREDVAIPLLRKNGISYFFPSANFLLGGGGRLAPLEAFHLDNARILFFAITSTSRGVAQMTLASYYMGLGCNVVLCIQRLTQGTIVNGEALSPAAISDYNRGRSYLEDQAMKERIPVFTDLEEALNCVVQKCKAR